MLLRDPQDNRLSSSRSHKLPAVGYQIRTGNERATDAVRVKAIEHPSIVVDVSRIPHYHITVVEFLIADESINVGLGVGVH